MKLIHVSPENNETIHLVKQIFANILNDFFYILG